MIVCRCDEDGARVRKAIFEFYLDSRTIALDAGEDCRDGALSASARLDVTKRDALALEIRLEIDGRARSRRIRDDEVRQFERGAIAINDCNLQFSGRTACHL